MTALSPPSLLTEMGIVGISILCILAFIVYKNSSKESSLAYSVGAIFLTLAAIVIINEYDLKGQSLIFFLWACVGVLIGSGKLAEGYGQKNKSKKRKK